MSNPRHLFILLGFLAQGLTWDSYLFLGSVTGLWCVAAGYLRGRVKTNLTTEAIALVVGCVLSVVLSRMTQRSAHFFLGDGLILLQAVRLTRELSKREKLTSLLIAAFHFGVLCTLAPNIRFLMLFGAAIFLFPGALKEVYHHSLDEEARKALSLRLVPSLRVALWLLLGSVFVFITFPRFTGTPLQLRDSMVDQGSLIDSILDPTRGGRANSQQILLQIEGDNIGYLRCFALTETDGVIWRALPKAPLLRLHVYEDREVANNPRFKHRRVFVKNAAFLGKMVPVDGMPVSLKRNFFDWPWVNKFSGALESRTMWTTGNNVYEYWIDPEQMPPRLQPDVRRRLLYHPPQSERLAKWLEETTVEGTNSYAKARLLESHLRKNFTYELGAPDLNRLAPVEDFIFNRKEGHCERFASSMALFLRMQGIPSRVVVGYVASTRNLFTGRLQARFRDAHSWTEGYFDGLGWVTFDATPGPPPGSSGAEFLDFLEALDFAWYSHVVSFNGFAQRDLVGRSIRLMGRMPPGIWSNLVYVCLAFLILALLVRAVPRSFNLSFFRRESASRKRARHYYEEMLQVLARRGLAKPPQQTPIEFLDELRVRAHASYHDAEIVTQTFCRGYYGEKTLSPEEQALARQALERVKHGKPGAFHATDLSAQRN